MTQPGDVLDSGAPARTGRWVAVAVLAVLALVGWNILGPEPETDRPVSPAVGSPSTGWVAGPGSELPASPHRADQLTFVDDEHGFLVQYLCSESSGGDSCPRRILATEDGGGSWEGRAMIPPYADEFYALVARSEFDLILLDRVSAASVVRSFDGGRSWAQLPTTRAEPAPVPAGAGLVGAGLVGVLDPACPQPCPVTLSWIDPNTLQLHPLPRQPAAGGNVLPQPASVASDGDIAVAAAAPAAGLVSLTTDGGATWIESRLEVPLLEGQEVAQVGALAAGGGRAYLFIQVFDESGVAGKYGFRTDDGGAGWTDLGFEDQRLWIPAGVIDGELISTDLPGRTFLSVAFGTRWAEVGTAPRSPYLAQVVPDGPVLATLVNSQGFESYHVSPDGRRWKPMQLPEV